MKPKEIFILFVFQAVFSVTGEQTLIAQTNISPATDSSIYKEISYLDAVLFTAFNKRDTAIFDNLFRKDLEFYHDKSGLSGYDQTINFLREMIKVKSDLKRELVPGSLEVYPIPGYGAMEIGKHSFCHSENGKQICGTFKFIHIWQKKNNEWKISRVISYDH